MSKYSRRQILLGGAAAGGALLVGYGVLSPSRQQVAQAAHGSEDEHFVTQWIRIGADNKISIFVPHSEMGQGVLTSVAMMAAEELEADWETIEVIQAPGEKIFANGPLGQAFLSNGATIPSAIKGIANFSTFKIAEMMNLQITGGSTAVRFTGHHGMRPAGAAAREMLIMAAGEKWNVPLVELEAAGSKVVHKKSGKSATYGELATLAAQYTPSTTPPLKNNADFKIIGTPVPRVDIPAKVDGTAQYGIDAKVDGMVYAAIRQAPVFGGELVSVDKGDIASRRGIIDVVEMGDAVAVVADSYWRAQNAANDLDVEFTAGDFGDVSTESISAQFDADIAANEGEADVEKGDIAASLGASYTHLDAVYRVPFLAHATMEPMNCTVAFNEDGTCDVWTGTQDVLGTRGFIASVAEMDDDKITVHPLMLGGGFGRRSAGSPNFLAQAVTLAKQVGKPVKLVWSREEDMQHDYYRPAVTAHMTAAIDDHNNIDGWQNKYVRKDEPVEASHIPYAVPNQNIRYVESEVHVPYGPWRSVAHTQHTFFNESFADELAHATGKDPYIFRRDLLKDKPRHLAVLNKVAEMSDWGGALEPGHARGIAIQESFQSLVAEVVDVSLVDGAPRVHKVWAAVDPGYVVNPDGARAQVESGIVYGLTAALYGEITIEDGQVMQENFPDYQMIRMADAPVIDIAFVETPGAHPGGLGEPATPPIAPAVANALFSLTGKRIRSLPIQNHDLTDSQHLASAAD
ncbi:MAG: isoquinoline 1-oxidoreductase beta subunit [Parvibaculaceae bacterium]|jgi:isoquinoline 1-oxidoreductase beta subunit